MYPYIITPWGDISTFTIFVAIGVGFMFLSVHYKIKPEKRSREEAYIFPAIVFAGIMGFGFATFIDFIFKYVEYGIIKIYGMTFYGGLIGASIVMYFILKRSRNETEYAISEWFDILTPSFIIFHIFGRLGCFFGGCCYGRYSQSVFAIIFPDNKKMGIIHNGLSCYPTQLFETVALCFILFIVAKAEKKYETYLTCYAVTRFFLEYLRGDDRGVVFHMLSPSQLISIMILVWVLSRQIQKNYKEVRKRRKSSCT